MYNWSECTGRKIFQTFNISRNLASSRATATGQHPPPSMTSSDFESRRYLSQQVTDGVMSIKLSALVKLLTDKYKRHYSKLLPIPWNDDIHLNLHDVYTTLEVKKVKGATFEMGAELENLHDMFKSSDDRRIRIEGAPAMGKSTLCRKLAYDWSCGELQQYTLLFFLEMRHVVELDMVTEIFHQLIPDDFDLSKQELSELISQYKESLLFLCDGLDELDDSHLTKTDIPKLIAGNLYYWCTAVITTRPHLCDNYLKTCDLFLLVKGFTSDRTNEYILKYFKDDNIKGDLLIQQIEKQKVGTDFITDLLENPLHVSFLCILWEFHKVQGYSFPETLTKLYSEILECVLKRYCAKNKIDLIDSELPEEIISEIDALALDSYKAYRNKKTMFDKSDISSEASLNFGLLVKDLGHALRKFRRKITFSIT
ncbi:NLR family CARD domain-containing protein 4-like [Ptychodera flava]|uniref:NLR family CARD domain-containing protein 4-like n=1 Tax=Ptychodera flava TaxID=63121 RepID=UPI003969DFAA